jgi:hypothetical protein
MGSRARAPGGGRLPAAPVSIQDGAGECSEEDEAWTVERYLRDWGFSTPADVRTGSRGVSGGRTRKPLDPDEGPASPRYEYLVG